MAKTPSRKGSKGRKKGGNKRRRKPRYTYSSYIYKVLKQVHPETGISKRGMSIMNSFINDAFDRICGEAAKLKQSVRNRLLSPNFRQMPPLLSELQQRPQRRVLRAQRCRRPEGSVQGQRSTR